MASGKLTSVRDEVDTALDRALAVAEMEGVYLSPWWPIDPSEPGGALLGWKRSILRREPGRGAVHWGHLYLMIAPGARPSVGSPSGPLHRIALPGGLEGSPSLWLRARLPEPCRRLAEVVGAELARPASEAS